MNKKWNLFLLVLTLCAFQSLAIGAEPADLSMDFLRSMFDKHYEACAGQFEQLPMSADQLYSLFDQFSDEIFSPSGYQVINQQTRGRHHQVNLVFDYRTSHNVPGKKRVSFHYQKKGDRYYLVDFNQLIRSPRQSGQANTNVQPVSSGTGISNVSSYGSLGDISQLASSPQITQLLNDPELLMSLMDNPALLELSRDPQVLRAIQSGDYKSLMTNPKIIQLMQDPSIQKLLQKAGSDPSIQQQLKQYEHLLTD